jgi:hypothetical protein
MGSEIMNGMEVAQQLFIWFHSGYTLEEIYNNPAFRDKVDECIMGDMRSGGNTSNPLCDSNGNIYWSVAIEDEEMKEGIENRINEINTCLGHIDAKNEMDWKVVMGVCPYGGVDITVLLIGTGKGK